MDNEIIDLSQKYRKSLSKINNDPNLIHNIQQNLLHMGFELNMINKVIANYPIQTTEEAVFLLMKTDGYWNHKFILQKDKQQDKEEISGVLLTAAMSKAREKSNQEVCEICNDLKALHIENRENPLLKKRSSILMAFTQELGRDDSSIKNEDKRSSIVFNDPEPMSTIKEEEQRKLEEQECGICMGEFDNPIQIQPCEHKFCQDCFNGYINDKITTNNVENINCPKALCENELDSDLFLKDLTDDMILKYHAFKKKNEIAHDPYKVFCPLCESYAQKNPDAQDEKYSLECLNGHSFCSCGRTEHQGSCYKEGKEYTAFILHEKIKKCPKCGFLINKNKGCNHMKCGNPQCQFEFCWLCMRESLPDHYSFGQCEGMQFIDEEGLLFKLRRYPCLFKSLKCLYNLFHCLLFLLVVIFLIAVPHPLIMIITYHFIIKNPEGLNDVLEIRTASPRFLRFMTWGIINGICVGLSSIYYFIFSIGVSILFLGGLIYFTYKLLSLVFYCLCCCCLCPRENAYDNSNDQSMNMSMSREGNGIDNQGQPQSLLEEQLHHRDDDVALQVNPQ